MIVGFRQGEEARDRHGRIARGGVEITAPSRLHFGLFSWGNPGRRFGGVGVMIEPPGLRIVVETRPESNEDADDLVEWVTACGGQGEKPEDSTTGRGGRVVVDPLLAETFERIAEARRRWTLFHGLPTGPPLRWRIFDAPPRHAGLGSGTQWGLSVAAALDVLSGRAIGLVGGSDANQRAEAACRIREQWVREAAASVGRGLRSAIGAYGFALGGCLIEPGKMADETLSPLERRFAVPDDWRFVLVRPRITAETSTAGLHGAAERQAFARLPPVPNAVTERLREIALKRLAPAVERADCAAFGDAVYEYGVVAGNCFAPVQGGPFNGPVLAELVARMRALGARGVGQSSWGPTLFAVLPNEMEAASFAQAIAAESCVPVDVRVAVPNNQGAAIRQRVFEESVSSERSLGR